MLVVAGKIQIDPANSDAAIGAALEVMKETHKESGCISYTFSRDLAEPGGFLIFEEWESEEALAKHFTQPHMAAFQKKMGGFGVKSMDVKKYQVSSVGPIR